MAMLFSINESFKKLYVKLNTQSINESLRPDNDLSRCENL